MFLQAVDNLPNLNSATSLITHPTMWAVGILVVVLLFAYKVWDKTTSNQTTKDLKQIEIDGKTQEKTAEALKAIQEEMKIYFDGFQKVVDKNAESRDNNSRAIVEQAASIAKLAESNYKIVDEVRTLTNVMRIKPCGKDLPNG